MQGRNDILLLFFRFIKINIKVDDTYQYLYRTETYLKVKKGKKYTGKILKTKTWIDIDVDVAYGQKPVLLRLDNLQEFYAD